MKFIFYYVSNQSNTALGELQRCIYVWESIGSLIVIVYQSNNYRAKD